MVYSVKREELHAHRCKKYPRTCPRIRTKNNEFFFFTIVFLQPFALFFSFFFFLLPFLSLFLFIFLRIIYYGFIQFPPSTCGSDVGSPFFLLSLPLLEPSIHSCKTACSLARHHLHVNAARELAGQHLMRG